MGRRILGALLLALEPLRFAAEALRVLPTLAYRGAPAMFELAFHGGVAALAAVGGLALWNGAPDARRLASVAVLAMAARSIQSLYWSALPSNTSPGTEPFYAAATLLAAITALALLHARR
ncbi:MAG TPA: hypothetical protein VM364_12700 [Vicinamibacterales bacterium]|nr:hypothetical protein [Vicinamibacterales bacterium]